MSLTDVRAGALREGCRVRWGGETSVWRRAHSQLGQVVQLRQWGLPEVPHVVILMEETGGGVVEY